MSTPRPPTDRIANRILLTLKLGEMPDHLPGLRAVVGYGTPLAEHIDGGPVDRLLRHYCGAFKAARLHSARTPRRQRPVPGGRRFDAVEQISGVARVLRIEIRDPERLANLLQALGELPTVERVSQDHLALTPMDLSRDTASTAQHGWAREAIGLTKALRREPGDPAVLIGLADTGVALEHQELVARVRAGFDSVDLDPAAVGGMTLVGNYRHPGASPRDDVGHGTGCAGILVARGRELPAGAAGECGLTPVRVLGAALGPGNRRIGVGAMDNIDAGMKRLIDLGVKVINMSFGTPDSALSSDAPRPHLEVVNYALARGVILVAASGNSGIEENYYPAAHDGVIAVGAVDASLRPTSFTTRGDHVALCAPGRDIYTCGLSGYQSASGTSFAAPYVTAVCALLVSRAQRRAWPLSGIDARQILTQSTRPFASPGVNGCGSGVLDAFAALRLLDARVEEELADEPRASEGSLISRAPPEAAPPSAI